MKNTMEDSSVGFMEDYCGFDQERVYLLIAIARSKDNPFSSSEKFAFREVVRNEEDILRKYRKLKALTTGRAGKGHSFYLYLSVNARNATKAYFNFRSRMDGWVKDRLNGAENLEKFRKLDKSWLSELSKPSSRDETNFLIDVDEDDELGVDKVRDILADRTTALTERRTPNGWHIVTEPFNYNDSPVELEIKTDALLFLERIRGGENHGE